MAGRFDQLLEELAANGIEQLPVVFIMDLLRYLRSTCPREFKEALGVVITKHMAELNPDTEEPGQCLTN